jgi:ribosomal protein L7Ae-like RNA K-turn-binding protein
VGSNSLAYIGLAYRAGRALAGTAACEKGIKTREVRLLLMQRELSEGTRNKFLRISERSGVEVRVVDEPGSIGRAIGRPEVMLVGVLDRGLADAARNIIDGVKGSGLNE